MVSFAAMAAFTGSDALPNAAHVEQQKPLFIGAPEMQERGGTSAISKRVPKADVSLAGYYDLQDENKSLNAA